MEWNDLSSMLGELTGTFGRQIPLIVMAMGKKRAVFVEYYDRTAADKPVKQIPYFKGGFIL